MAIDDDEGMSEEEWAAFLKVNNTPRVLTHEEQEMDARIIRDHQFASVICPAAIVSLLTVLGDSGILNNYTYTIFCVVPIEECQTFRLGEHRENGVDYYFIAMPKDAVFAAAEEDLFDPIETNYQRASNEAALAQWIYLATPPSDALAMAPREIEVDDVDWPKLERICAAMGVSEQLAAWRETVIDLNAEQIVTPGLGL
jgi:hypothetical protein